MRHRTDAADKKVIATVRALFSDPQVLGDLAEARRRDLGFGAERVSASLYGGDHSAYVTAVCFGGNVAALHVSAPVAPDAPTPALRAAWGDFASDREGFAAEHRVSFMAVLASMDAARRGVLGTSIVEIPPALRPDVEALTDPLSVLTVGVRCYYEGRFPPGREAVLRVADHGDEDLLLWTLRSANPEGRVYAAWQLASYGVHTPEVQTALSHLRALDIPHETCEGCELFDADFDGALGLLMPLVDPLVRG